MRLRSTPIILVIAMLLTSPLVGAAWMVSGEREPDTWQDVADGYMFQDPAGEADRQVYFSGQTRMAAGVGSVNPNVGAAGSRVMAPFIQMAAYLGIWADCNGDGYIGHAETALLEYRVELGQDGCAVGGDHVNDVWVSEFIPVVGQGGGFNVATPPGAIFDPAARVWGDFGLPGATFSPDCEVPPPSGTTGTTGGLLALIDCQAGTDVPGAVNTLDDFLGTDLGFEDPDEPGRDCSSPLNQELPVSFFGDPYCGDGKALLTRGESHEAVVFDCDDETLGITEAGFVADPTHSYAEAGDRLEDCAGERAGTGSFGLMDLAELTYPIIENPSESSSQLAGKRQPDITFSYNSIGGLADLTLGLTDIFTDALGLPNPATDGPSDLGLHAATMAAAGDQWRSLADAYGPMPTLVRGNLAPAGANYVTFYAAVGDATLQLAAANVPSPAAGTYGAEACQGATAGVVNTWNCDSQMWWQEEAYSGTGAAPRAGDDYQLRDIDCYDGTLVRGSGVQASLAALSAEGICADISPVV